MIFNRQDIEKYLDYVMVTKSDGTYNFEKNHLFYLFKNYNTDKPDLLAFMRDQKKKGCSNATINKRVSIFKKYFKYYNISFEDVPHLKEEYKTFHFLNYYQIVKLLKFIDDPTNCIVLKTRLMIHLFLDTGVRLTELLNIKVSNIDLDNYTIYLDHTKTKEDRFVFFTDDTKKLIVDLLRTSPNTYLIDYKYSSVETIFKRLNEVLNFQYFSPHTLRHTYATILVNNNVNLEFIRLTLGHKSLAVTKRYLHMQLDNMYQTYKKGFNF